MANTGENINIRINGERLEQVEKYVYRGQRIKLNRENREAEIVRRIKLSWAAFGKLRDILENKKLAHHQKNKSIRYVCSASDNVRLPNMDDEKRNMYRLIRTQRSMKRRMLHIILKDRKCNTWIRARTRVTDARERATRLKYQYVGRSARQEDNRWNAQILS